MAEHKKALKPIPPTLRGKKRYISFYLHCESNLDENAVKKEIWRVFGGIFGEKGIAEQKLWLVKWYPEKNKGILRCSLKELENVKAGLLFISSVSGVKTMPLIDSVSGSVKKLR
ncbi:MAG: ribonuclease P protein component 2 [Candidatus Diapherotrites archaeon CG11_big_fil_rev_8_21_14_0_20_37_9]|nr:MAG: ribonuclease P protein component 2 [Candidatus Diapherotrites archaeon CG11_big_fil_rev_8_21_14_0_20_37_9]